MAEVMLCPSQDTTAEAKDVPLQLTGDVHFDHLAEMSILSTS